jgi:hypothetical protein
MTAPTLRSSPNVAKSPDMDNPDPRLYREAEVALQLEECSYRGFLSRGRIAGRLRRLLGGREWDFRKPYLGPNEADRLRRDLEGMGVDARWEGGTLVITDPEGRWRPVRISPNRHGLYQVGGFGRAERPGSGFEREWEEVVPLPRDRPLSAESIAEALDTERSLGPAFRRIEDEVDLPVLLDAMSVVQTSYARERLCILLAHHRAIVKALPALPLLSQFLDDGDRQLRRSSAYAIATVAGRVGRTRAGAAAPELATLLRERYFREEDDSVRDELQAALGALGEPPPEPRDDYVERFTQDVRGFLDFLKEKHGFEEPTVEQGWFSTRVTYRNDTTAVVASADWRDSYMDVLLVELRDGALPIYLNGVNNSLPPSLVLEVVGGEKRLAIGAHPQDVDQTRRVLEREAEALRRCEDLLRGDFTRFHLAVARLAEERR